MSEKKLMNDVALWFTKMGGRCFRHNVGQAWQGRGKPVRAQMPMSVRLMPGDVILRQAVPVHFGLHKGGADQLGWLPVKITQEMVGQTIAQFASVESKYGTTPTTPEQITWRDNVAGAGGFAKIIRDISELENG